MSNIGSGPLKPVWSASTSTARIGIAAAVAFCGGFSTSSGTNKRAGYLNMMHNFPHCLCPSRPHHREGLQEERSAHTANNSRRETRRVGASTPATGPDAATRGATGTPDEHGQHPQPAAGGAQHHHTIRQSLQLFARGGREGGGGGGKDSIFRALVKPNKDGTIPDGHAGADGADLGGLPAGADGETNNVEAAAAAAASSKFRRDGFVFASTGQLTDVYNVETKKLGQGTYGSVSRAVCKTTKTTRAVKAITKAKVKNVKRLKQEIAVMKCLDHPNIVKLFETFEDHKNLYLVLELCKGGELFDRIIEEGYFSETYAASLMKQVFAALHYIHKNGIVHRDLKPENFLFLDKSKDSPLKIIDFGLAARCGPNTILATKAGTPYYVAPQVLQGKYNYKCDMWSAGVIMYILLCGYPPFHGDNDAEILAKVKSGKFTFNEQDWKNVSVEAKDLIRKLLCYDPTQRLSAEQALAHPWIKHYACRPNPEADIPLSKQILENFKAFRALSKLKKAALTVIAQQMNESQIKGLKNTFLAGFKKSGLLDLPSDLEALMQEVDSDGSGVIDYTEFIAASMNKPQYVQEDVCWAAFRVFDIDANGRITAEELAQVLLSPETLNPYRLETGSAAPSQSLIIDEKKFAKEQHRQAIMEMRTLILDVDRNGDGEALCGVLQIDFDEFMEMMRKAEPCVENSSPLPPFPPPSVKGDKVYKQISITKQ